MSTACDGARAGATLRSRCCRCACAEGGCRVRRARSRRPARLASRLRPRPARCNRDSRVSQFGLESSVPGKESWDAPRSDRVRVTLPTARLVVAENGCRRRRKVAVCEERRCVCQSSPAAAASLEDGPELRAPLSEPVLPLEVADPRRTRCTCISSCIQQDSASGEAAPSEPVPRPERFRCSPPQ